MAVIFYFKTPPSYFKKSGTQFCILFKTPLPTLWNAVTTTKEPIKWQKFVFIQNAPPLLVRLLFDLQFALQIDQMESMFLAQFQIALNSSEFGRAQN